MWPKEIGRGEQNKVVWIPADPMAHTVQNCRDSFVRAGPHCWDEEMYHVGCRQHFLTEGRSSQ